MKIMNLFNIDFFYESTSIVNTAAHQSSIQALVLTEKSYPYLDPFRIFILLYSWCLTCLGCRTLMLELWDHVPPLVWCLWSGAKIWFWNTFFLLCSQVPKWIAKKDQSQRKGCSPQPWRASSTYEMETNCK